MLLFACGRVCVSVALRMFKRIPGTKDILPDQIDVWQTIEAISREAFSLYNYREIRPPLIEEASLFNRSLGDGAEIVQKQMFLIQSSSDAFALRPEATASIARAYIENSLDKTTGFTKVYYMGPMFRMERPQKGRLRQFHHIGCEAIGSQDPALDVEVIALADKLLKAFAIDGYELKVNSLGCAKDKSALSDMLRAGLGDKLGGLCDDCKGRFERNILRIMDCKNEACQQAVEALSIGNSYLCPECKEHFTRVTAGLDALKINYRLSPSLVRGLDYYTRTVFEAAHKELGPQQNALGAGGRYDNLISQLGGPSAGAIGFAFGMERLLLVRRQETAATRTRLVYLIALGEEAKREGVKLLESLRAGGVSCDTDYENKSLKGALRKANDLGAACVLILGEDELKKETVMLKDMVSGEQKEVERGALAAALQKTLC